MDNILPIEAKEINFLKKITNFIKKIFYKNKSAINEKSKENDKFYQEEKLNVKLIKEINEKKTLQEIIAIIEKNPEIMKNLDIHKLEMIDNYYKEQIEECKKKIARIS